MRMRQTHLPRTWIRACQSRPTPVRNGSSPWALSQWSSPECTPRPRASPRAAPVRTRPPAKAKRTASWPWAISRRRSLVAATATVFSAKREYSRQPHLGGSAVLPEGRILDGCEGMRQRHRRHVDAVREGITVEVVQRGGRQFPFRLCRRTHAKRQKREENTVAATGKPATAGRTRRQAHGRRILACGALGQAARKRAPFAPVGAPPKSRERMPQREDLFSSRHALRVSRRGAQRSRRRKRR
jgi:hypothetical protein